MFTVRKYSSRQSTHTYTRVTVALIHSSPATTIKSSRPITTVINPRIEEEIYAGYHAENFCPMTLGQPLGPKYRVLAKLGFGRHSTTWLAQDVTRLRVFKDRFVVIKVLTRAVTDDKSATSELAISECIARAGKRHEGLRYVRTMIESFKVQGPSGEHTCLVYTTMRETLSTFQRRIQDQRVPSDVLKVLLKILLTGLDFLHRRCHVIHTDLKPQNILVGIEDDSIIHELVQAEKENPSPAKYYDDHRIYAHRNFGVLRAAPGRPKIADFGNAVIAPTDGTLLYHPIQPDLLQAPEVIWGAGWSYSADIWNLGIMIWDLMENRPLFRALNPDTGEYSAHLHLGEIISMLGPPPMELLLRGRSTAEFFTADGNLIDHDIPVKRGMTLEGNIAALSGEDKAAFLRFVTKMLRWMPEDRATAGEFLADPWICS